MISTFTRSSACGPASRSWSCIAARRARARREHIPAALVAHLIGGAAACIGSTPLIEHALRAGYSLQPERIECPVRIVWGRPTGSCRGRRPPRYREDWLPQADWVELEGVGHCPQLDVPLETAQLILGFTAP